MLGISQNIDIFQMGFLAGTSIEDISQIESICLDMEHSYMGDLVIYVTCPNGQQVMLHQQGGGGTQIGVPNQADNIDCDDPTTQGTPYHYCFTPTASQTWVQWVTAQGGFGNTLPEGDYAAVQPIDQLVGCPTNGIWTLTVVDNWAADDGQLVGFQLNLDSALYPEVFEFTPQIDPNASSSYWNSNPAYGFINDSNSDELTIAPLAAGDYTYTYTVIDDFGCVNDTFFTAHVFEALQVAAPADLVYACGDITLQGWFANLPPPVCANCGTFSYCYNDGDNLTWTFCPDNPGDGTTLSFEFLSGQMEGWFETFTIYDGSSTMAPTLGTWTTGDATGQVWTATNTDGCLTVHFTSDASVSCASGSFQPWSYEISPGGPDYTWEWSPATYMDDPSLQAPTVSAVPQQTTYTVVGYPVGHPGCASSDEVTVTIDPLGDPGLDATLTVCSNDAPFDLFSQLGGNPVTTGTWTDPNGNPLSPNPQFNPMTDAAGDYTYTVQMNSCSAFATVHIDMNPPLQVTVANDTALCYMGLLNMDLISTLDGNPPFTFQWTYNGVAISNAPDYNNYHPTNSGNACLTVTDVCGYAVQECFLVDVKPPVQPLIYSPVNTVCWPDPLIIQNLTDPTSFVTAVWNISDGFTTTNVDSLSHIFTNPGSYNVTLTLEDNIGCVYDTTAFGLLTAYAPPQANFQTNPQPAQADNTTITFTDLTLGEQIVNYYWVFDTTNVLGTADYANPVFTFPIGVGGDYPVNLVVVDINGCTDQTTGIVHINELLNIFIPNAFTPNGDNINDAIGFVGTDLDEKNFELTIFNRWGETVFHTKDVHAFWQGEANNGDYYVPNGAYNYIAHIRSISTGEKKVINGQIILDR
jgi:gliding motility-associated-like protein